MAVTDVFDPRTDGWFFENWGEDTDFTWDLYRRTHLSIHPTDDPVLAPLDHAYFQIFKSCAAEGNCGGMAMLALAVFKYGGFFGYGSPANFYTGGPDGPDRSDLHEAVNIFQARQFSAPGIRNFLDVVKAGQLNDGIAAWHRISGGLASGDYHVLSLSSGLFGDAAHTVIPYRATQSGGTYTLWVWDPNRPYDAFPAYYDGGFNRIVITSPTGWSYDQNAGGFSGGHNYLGSQNGWFFAIPTSLILHKGRQPISVAFAITGLTYLFVSGTGAAVTQIEDSNGRRLFRDTGVHTRRDDLETSPSHRLEGVAPWPFTGGLPGTGRPGELYVTDRPPSSAPLRVTVRGDYTLQRASAGSLTEVAPVGRTKAPDEVLFDDDAVEVRTHAARRRFDLRQIRTTGPGEWHGVHLRDVLVTDDSVRMRAPGPGGAVEVSGSRTGRELDIEFERLRGRRLSRSHLGRRRYPAGGPLVVAPGTWEAVPRRRRKT
ncbi:hypothetical protein [Phytohabitans aurantiacus]|uniref:Peptidase C39-like domain-containing protein n=1 Tax=Phytohabitans aurantiacus TaxID=3016789 RepID=A0ABQ5R9D9_9ACTN|nr:hypothetical protein [Phytohabitans aurantiacus]GLI03374.1 hypothetical protein Pa4123_86520 [Phytohabitans aurantiacus]